MYIEFTIPISTFNIFLLEIHKFFVLPVSEHFSCPCTWATQYQWLVHTIYIITGFHNDVACTDAIYHTPD